MRGILDCSYESLKVTAGFAKNTVSYFRSIHDAIEKYDVKSEGLLGIKKFCEDMSENASLDEISSIASKFQRDSLDAYEFYVKTEADDSLTITSSSISEAVENEEKSLGKSFKRFLGSLGKTQGQDAETELDMGQYLAEEASDVLNEALYELYSVLSAIAGSIYEFFQGLSGELSFYDTALKYCRWLSDAGMPMCMPKLLPKESQSFKANDIYDMQLILEGLDSGKIVRNPVRFEGADEGALIRGDNSCGKTAYLRAIGTAQIFAQAGLPVCASGAGISVKTAVFTQFSSSEKDFSIGDVAGRFEGEVQDMARILDDIKPYSLVLLNETFQTTAYAEGAEGIKGILDVLPDVDSKFVFVTRLVQLFDTMDSDKIKKLRLSAEGDDAFKIGPWEG
jgi:DNA mismatch repair ATPase MutS